MRFQDDLVSDLSSLSPYSLWVHRFGKLNFCCHKIISHSNNFNCGYNCIQRGNDTTKYSWKYHLPPCLSGQQCDYSSHLRAYSQPHVYLCDHPSSHNYELFCAISDLFSHHSIFYPSQLFDYRDNLEAQPVTWKCFQSPIQYHQLCDNSH